MSANKTQNIIEVPGLLGDINEDITKPQQHLYGDTINGKKLPKQGGDVVENFDLDNKKPTNNIEKEKKFDINEYFGEEKIASNPATPTLKRILNISQVEIKKEDLDKIYKSLDKLDPKEDVILNLIEVIDSLNIDKDISQKISNTLLDISKNNDSRLKEGKDGKIELPKEFKGNKLLENDKYQNIVNLLAKNYISFPNNKGDANFDKDLALDIETTVNKVVYGKNFSKNEGFEVAMRDIYSKNLETRLEALNYIYLLVNTNEGKEGKASKLSYNKIKQKENGEKQSLQERFTDFQKISKEALYSKNIEELQKLLEEVKPMLEEAKTNGEVFIASDLETIKGEIDSVLKETT